MQKKMSWHEEFFDKIKQSTNYHDCITFGWCTVGNRDLNKPRYDIPFYLVIYNVSLDDNNVKPNRCRLPQHYYHQNMSLIRILWFHERLTRALEPPLHSPLITIVLEYLL
jgi:hypothetical protein